MVTLKKRPPTAKGFVFITMEDEDGLVNVIVKPDAYQQYYKVLRNYVSPVKQTQFSGPSQLPLRGGMLRALPCNINNQYYILLKNYTYPLNSSHPLPLPLLLTQVLVVQVLAG